MASHVLCIRKGVSLSTHLARAAMPLPSESTFYVQYVLHAPLQVHNGKDFGQSLPGCPKLKTFSAYKL